MNGWLPALASALVAALTVFVVCQIWPAVLPARPESGERGRRRLEALRSSSLYRAIEPLLRVLAGRIGAICPRGLRESAQQLMMKSGLAFGMDGDDLLALSVLASVGAALVCGSICAWLDRGGGPGVVLGGIFGSVFPWFKFQDVAKARLLAISRGLPGVIDLIVLSMESGLDFPGAVQQISKRLDSRHPIRFELEHLLHKLALGWSRQQALQELSERVPILPIRQFVSAVIQAEKRGTPLGEVLATQAEVMRLRRSQHAEQAAARAAVLIIGPLMLIFACVFAIIIGPFVIKYLRGELF
jgi:tight adherence protein C